MNSMTLRLLGWSGVLLLLVSLLAHFIGGTFLHDLLIIVGLVVAVAAIWEGRGHLLSASQRAAFDRWLAEQLGVTVDATEAPPGETPAKPHRAGTPEAGSAPASAPVPQSAETAPPASKRAARAAPSTPAPAQKVAPVEPSQAGTPVEPVEPVEPVGPPPTTIASGTGEAVQLLMLFQQKGRFVDFLMDDISKATDAQLSSAARVVHDGCRSIIKDYMTFEPVCAEPEASTVKVDQQQQQSHYKVTGNLSGEPPYQGTVRHRGWKLTRLNIPRLSPRKNGEWPPVAPAEVEVK